VVELTGDDIKVGLVESAQVPMKLWRRPLHAMTDAFTAAGFRLTAISEPRPDPAARETFPEGFQYLSTNPNFLLFVVEIPLPATSSCS
jgi:hypothetical protein